MTVSAKLAYAIGRAKGARSQALQLPNSRPIRKASVTASGTSQTLNIVAPADAAGDDMVWMVDNAGSGGVWVRFSSSGSPAAASAGNDWFIAAASTGAWTARAGDTVTVINA